MFSGQNGQYHFLDSHIIVGIVSLAHFSFMFLSLFLTPTLVRYLSQHEAEAVRHTSVHYANLGCLCNKKANQNGGDHASL